MRPLSIRFALVVALLPAAAAIAHAEDVSRVHYLDIVNRAHERLVALSAAPVGGEPVPVVLGEDLQGGGNSATVRLPLQGCVQDLRLEFRNGQQVLYPAVDVCAHRGLTILPAHARRMTAEELQKQQRVARGD
ncbi:hypothetical protein [Pseudoxanthomonas sp. Root630]|uniref:hypothetical protein n=1 Tax=Pseudoxanthomonas sp. Root630 TaxID=1736574 RepID=UPI000702E3F1|nr:hypothetical protein [Pseudoxanthomonas sp. Root630]KRA46218.1 hypothetical protein ASD72_03060 [Pseudoxanthomonas sp. Root630]